MEENTRKTVNVHYDVWYELNMLRIKNPRKYHTIEDVIKDLLDGQDEEDLSP